MRVSGATRSQLRDRESVFVARIVSLGGQEPESQTLEKIGCIYGDISPAEVRLGPGSEDHRKGWMLAVCEIGVSTCMGENGVKTMVTVRQ